MRTFFEKEIQWIWVIICTYIAVLLLWIYRFYLYEDFAWGTMLIIAMAVGAIYFCFYWKKHAISKVEQFNEKMVKKELQQEKIEDATHEKELKKVKLETAYIDKEMKQITNPPEEKKSELEQHQEREETKAAKRLTKQEIRIQSEVDILEQSQEKERGVIEKRDRKLIEFKAEILQEYDVEDEGQLPPDGIERLDKGRRRIREKYLQIIGRLE